MKTFGVEAVRNKRGARPRDHGFVGATLHLEGRFVPQTLAELLPWEPVLMGRRGEQLAGPVPRRNPKPLTRDYLKLDVSRLDLESTLAALCREIERLSPEAVGRLAHVAKKTLDLGLSTSPGCAMSTFLIPANVVLRLGTFGIGVEVSVYPPAAG